MFKLKKYSFISVLCFFVLGDTVLLYAKSDESKELSRLMEFIDRKYKAAEVISGYYDLSDDDWDTYYDSGIKVAEYTVKVQKAFGRPDNLEYQRLMEEMRVAGQKMAEIAKESRGKDGAMEDVQWQVRLMRNTCAHCHKLLNIHIYPNLYQEKRRSGESQYEEEWGKPK